MTNRWRLAFVVGATLVAASIVVLRWIRPAPPALDERSRIFGWLDSLGFENGLAKPLVKIEAINTGLRGSKSDAQPTYGFSLHENGNNITLLGLDFSRIRYPDDFPPSGIQEFSIK